MLNRITYRGCESKSTYTILYMSLLTRLRALKRGRIWTSPVTGMTSMGSSCIVNLTMSMSSSSANGSSGNRVPQLRHEPCWHSLRLRCDRRRRSQGRDVLMPPLEGQSVVGVIYIRRKKENEDEKTVYVTNEMKPVMEAVDRRKQKKKQ